MQILIVCGYIANIFKTFCNCFDLKLLDVMEELESLQWLHYYEQNNDDYSVNQMEVIYLLYT